MGCSIWPVGGVKRSEEYGSDGHTIGSSGSPHRAAKNKEKTGDVNRRPC
jgi:hypothetical protein